MKNDRKALQNSFGKWPRVAVSTGVLTVCGAMVVGVGWGGVGGVGGGAAYGQVERALENVPLLRGELVEFVRTAAADELIPVTMVLRTQLSASVRAQAVAIPDKSDRRAFYIQALKDQADRSQVDLLKFLADQQLAGTVTAVRPLWIHNVVGARVTPAVLNALAARTDLAYINYNQPVPVEDIFPVEPAGAPGPQAIECGVDLMEADRVWDELGITGSGVVVGHIDSGVCPTHPDIQNQIWNNAGEIPNNGIDDDNNGYVDDTWGWNFDLNNNNPDDFFGHGSHTAGTVAGDGSGGTQAGMAPASEVMVLRISGSFAGEQEVWDATQYALDNGADMITASLGWPHSVGPDRATWRAVNDNAMAAGMVVIYAAGNEGCGTTFDNVRTPGDVPDLITVGATDCNDNLASFSSCGPVEWEFVAPYHDWPYPPGKMKPTISAPGVSTLSHSLCAGYNSFSGTSMSTPHVAGAVALMLEANPSLDHFAIKQLLVDTSVDLGSPGWDNQYGAGRVDAYQAVLAAGGDEPACTKLTVENLVAGEFAKFTLTRNLVRGETVVIAWGTGGNGSSYTNFDGYCATFGFEVPRDVINRRIVAQGFVDANSEFVVKRKVPPGRSGMAIMFQAAKRGTCPDECMSNVVEQVIQ